MKRHSQQEIAALALKSEDVEIIGDKIGKRITELFQQVKQNRTTTRVMGKSIDSWFGKLERAYHKIHELSGNLLRAYSTKNTHGFRFYPQ